MIEKKFVQTNIKLEAGLKKQLKFISLEKDMTLQELVNIILEENIEKYK